MYSKEMQAYMEMFLKRKNAPQLPIEEQRRGIIKRMCSAPLPEGTETEFFMLGNVRAERIRVPGARSDAVLFFIHGGGFTIGSAYSANFFGSRAALESKQTVISIEYRLGPEHQFADGLADCIAAYQEILRSGVPAEGITISGDSAGGYMSLALVMWLKMGRHPLPGSMVLLSPAVGFGLEAPTEYQMKHDVMLAYDASAGVREAYFREADLFDPVVNPIIGDFTGFPPTYIEVCTDEILFNDSLALAKKLGEAGCECYLHIAKGLCHGYEITMTPEAEAVAKETGRFIADCLKKKTYNV